MKKLTRRRFVVAAAAGIAGVAAPNAFGLPPDSTVYLLDPCAGRSEGGRCSCHACELHAANKIFSTVEAADAGRAHVHCDCGIVTRQVPPGVKQALSRHSTAGAADRRHLPRGLASLV